MPRPPGLLPFNSRPDLTPYLIHLTKNTNADDEYSGYDNLVNILSTGETWGSDTKKGFIKRPHKAACLMDVPFPALKYVLTPESSDPEKPRYEPYGIVLTKRYAYTHGCRPVLYLSDEETRTIGIPQDELWRVVRFEVQKQGWISWLHEREWLKLPGTIQPVLVKNTQEAARLTIRMAKPDNDFKTKAMSVLPLTVVSQGLLAP